MEKEITHTYHIDGMTCGGCATAVKNKLSNTYGVTSVHVDLAKKEAEITSIEAIKTDKLQSALIDTNYTISEVAPQLDKNAPVKRGGSCCG
jgi:copper chaperone